MTKKGDPRTEMTAEVEALTAALAAPFHPEEVRFKPGVVSGNRALALAYVDARAIQDRLDEVLGVTGWQDEYECLPDGSVVCRLHLRLGAEWITKMDVGGQSEQPDEGDRRKAAFSDALKRAAVKFGIGRYLYRLPQLWVDFDPQKRRFVRPPALPPEAQPKPQTKPQPRVLPAGEARKEARSASPAAARKAPANPTREPTPGPSRKGPHLPSSGEELQRRLYDYDERLAKQGVCAPGELVKYVVGAGQKAGYQSDLATWSGDAIRLAVEQTKAFENLKRQPAAPRKEVA
jgi:hypothetical protein